MRTRNSREKQGWKLDSASYRRCPGKPVSEYLLCCDPLQEWRGDRHGIRSCGNRGESEGARAEDQILTDGTEKTPLFKGASKRQLVDLLTGTLWQLTEEEAEERVQGPTRPVTVMMLAVRRLREHQRKNIYVLA